MGSAEKLDRKDPLEQTITTYQKLPPIIGKSALGRFFGSRAFLKLLIAIAIPVIIQDLITTAVNMLDTVMITPLGAHSIAAVGQVNQYFFFFQVILFGINSGGSIFYAQYHGRGDQQGIKLVLSICLKLSVAVSVLFTAISLLAAKQILHILAPDPQLVEIGVEYLHILSFSFVIFGLRQTFGLALRGIGQTKPTMYASLLAFAVNGVLNYVLIFGKIGFPAMGVKGAAIATCVARLVELLWIMHHVYRKDPSLRLRLKELTLFDSVMFKQYLKLAMPVITTETLWSLSQLLYSMAYVRISTDASAAVQLSATIQGLLFVFIMSLSAASAVIIGQAIGADEDKETVIQKMASRILRLTAVIGIICTVLEVFFPSVLMVFYRDLTPELWQMTADLLRVRGLFIVVRFMNSVLIMGVFRAGGDVRVPMLIEMLTTWLFAVPIAFVAGLYWQLGIFWTLALVTFEEVIKLLILLPRYFRRRWIHRVWD